MKAGDLMTTVDGVEVEILDIALDGIWVSDADCNEWLIDNNELAEWQDALEKRFLKHYDI